MRRFHIHLGDVYEIPTSNGKGLFQYVHQHKKIGELIRILPGLYETTPEKIDSIVNQKELYFVHFPLKAAYRRGTVDYLGNFDIPQRVSIPAHFREKHVVRGDFICWHIVDYATWKRTGPLSIDWTHGIEKITQHNRTFVRIEWV